ncbi:MAG TPA: ubiquitin-activating E1 FCCH domain-containing protein [Candidatus Glassbacteria bacterium]|nr:ubiquitin-activating E1 FCCH domain-containing protein [Candidatus Glassbacteria bacterium]
MSGQTPHRSDITNITNANPCVVTTTLEHGYENHDFVRLTDVNGSIPVARGMDQINNKKFRIIKIDDTSFSIENPITFEKINSTNYTPYITAGYCNLVEQTFIYNGDS